MATPEGVVVACNKAICSRLQIECGEITGRKVWEFLTDSSGDLLKQKIANPNRQGEEKFLLNFVDASFHPFTLECSVETRPDGFALIGALMADKNRVLQEELIALNNQLSVLLRENARQSKALKKTHQELETVYEDLRQSHWHLRKIQEVLPICAMCHKVKTSDGQWDELIKYFNENSDFLSHSYCPECYEQMMVQVRQRKIQKMKENGQDERN